MSRTYLGSRFGLSHSGEVLPTLPCCVRRSFLVLPRSSSRPGTRPGLNVTLFILAHRADGLSAAQTCVECSSRFFEQALWPGLRRPSTHPCAFQRGYPLYLRLVETLQSGSVLDWGFALEYYTCPSAQYSPQHSLLETTDPLVVVKLVFCWGCSRSWLVPWLHA